MKKSKFIAINAMALAIILIFMFVPIPMPSMVEQAVFVLITLIVCSQLYGIKSAIFTSLAFGITSFIAAFLVPTSPVSLIFRNPLVSILPRFFIGFVVVGVYKLMQKLLIKAKPQVLEVVSSSVSAIVGVCVNTGLVLLMISICYLGKTIEGTVITGEIIMGLISINFVIEVVICAIVCAPITMALKKALGIKTILKKPLFEKTSIDNTAQESENIITNSQQDFDNSVNMIEEKSVNWDSNIEEKGVDSVENNDIKNITNSDGNIE